MHQFPIDAEQRALWLEACHLPSAPLRALLCGNHFQKSDFFDHYGQKVPRLKPRSVPSRYLPVPSKNVITINRNQDWSLGLETDVETTVNGLPKDLVILQQKDNEHCYMSTKTSKASFHDKNYQNLLKENQALRLKLEKSKETIVALRSGNLPEPLKNRIVKDKLKGSFSVSQLDWMLSKKKRSRICNLTSVDLSKAMRLRCASTKAYKLVRKEHVPLPGLSTLNRKFEFMHVAPGIIKPMVVYFRQVCPTKSARWKLGVTAFDEMAIENISDIDRYLDMTVGPGKSAQVVTVRGIADDWKFPFFVDFDYPIKKDDLMQIIMALEDTGLTIFACTCDQGPQNTSLAKKLGITTEQTTFEHPTDSNRRVFFLYDWVHLFKSCRNNLLDHLVTLPNGRSVSKHDFCHLKQKVDSEITVGFQINDEHLDCQFSDRQDVKLATHLLSERTAALFHRFFPKDPKKMSLGDFLDILGKSFKILTSRAIYVNTDKFECGLRRYYQEQMEILEQLLHYMRETKFGPNKFAKGVIVTVTSIIQLHKLLSTEYNLPYLLTSRLTQDHLEAFFGMIRQMDGIGGKRVPSALEMTYRISRQIINTLCKEDDFNIFDLKPHLERSHLDHEPIEDTKIIIPHRYKECEEEGLWWISGYVAFKMKSIDKSLGSYKFEKGMDQAPSKFADLFNRGGLKYPTNKWLKDLKYMKEAFEKHHPKDGLRPGCGLVSNFFNKLKEKFPSYDKKVLHLTARVLTRFRTRTINKLCKEKKKGKKGKRMSLRGQNKQAMLAHCS